MDKVGKMAEYADARISFCWLAWLFGNHVLPIGIHVLDTPWAAIASSSEVEVSTVEVPVWIKINWRQLTHLVRQ